jgi:hypothetical protein
MKKIIYIIIALCVLNILNENLSIKNDNKQLIERVSQLEDEIKNKDSKILLKDKSKNSINDYEIEQVLSQRLYNVREDFKWLENKDFNKVILKDYEGNAVDITNDELFYKLANSTDNHLKNIVYPTGIMLPLLVTVQLPYYELTFFNNLEFKNKVIFIYDHFIVYDKKIYESDFLCSLAKAYMPIIQDLKSNENNLLNIIYKSELSVTTKQKFQKIEDIQIVEHNKFRRCAIYIAHNMEKVSFINNDDKLLLTEIYVGYKDSEKIYLYVYDYDIYDAKFVKIVFKDKEEYYEQKENLCIDGEPNENKSLYKLWGAG